MSDHWQAKRDEYKTSDWSDTPTIFAKFITEYLPVSGSLIDLGAGLGQDSLYFAGKGFDVTSTEIILDTKLTFPSNVSRKFVDTSQPLDFPDDSFDVVYAHLSLHYFDHATTGRIFSEIYRILKPSGIFAFLVNSTSDPEYRTGNEIEKDYFETAGTTKRYFDENTAREFAKAFEVIICDENGGSYKDQAKGVHGLVRFIGRKPK